jgi:hypothetical protein
MEGITKTCKNNLSTFNTTYRCIGQHCKTCISWCFATLSILNSRRQPLWDNGVMTQQASKMRVGHSLKDTCLFLSFFHSEMKLVLHGCWKSQTKCHSSGFIKITVPFHQWKWYTHHGGHLCDMKSKMECGQVFKRLNFVFSKHTEHKWNSWNSLTFIFMFMCLRIRVVIALLDLTPFKMKLPHAPVCLQNRFLFMAVRQYPPRRYPYFDVVVGLVWSHDPKSYAGGSVCYW